MEQEMRLKKKGVSGIVVFLLVILFLAIGLCGGWYVGHENLLPIENENEKIEKEEKTTENKEEKTESKIGECLNCKEGNEYINSEHSQLGISVYIGENQTSATINVSLAEVNNIYGLNLTSSGDNQYTNEIKVDDFNKKILQVKISGFGQAVGDEYIYYVMEDGTVEYTPIFNELKDNWNSGNALKKHTTMSGVSEVSYISGADVVNGTTGHYTTIAVKKDGSFYDLQPILHK